MQTDADDRVREALDAAREILSTVRATGGLVRQFDGLHGLAFHPDWIDLGEAVVSLASALGERMPVTHLHSPSEDT